MPVIFDTGALVRPAFTAADFAATKWDGGTGPGGDKAGGVALRQGFDSLWFGKHAGLSGEKRVYPGAQTRPIGWRQVWRPRLRRVIWRTCFPVRSEVTRRNVK